MVKFLKKIDIREWLLLLILISFQSNAQTGIGTTTPNASAKLDVYATNKGFLPPRVTLTSATDATTIASPAEGLLVYNLGSVGLQAGYYYWNSANWATIATATSAGNGVTASDLVKIYDGVGNAATINTNGVPFSVTTSGKYLFDFSTSGSCGNCTVTINFQVRDGANSNAVIASDMQTSYSNNVHAEYNGKVEVNLLAGRSYNVLVTASSGFIASNDYCRVYMKQVAGNLPVTGQTVDYVNVTRTTNQTVNTSNTIIFDTKNAGNIPYDPATGNFTLIAGKTYKLEGFVGLSNSSPNNSEIDFVWRTAAGVNLGNAGQILSANFTGAANSGGVTKVIYTPTSNTTVSLYINWASTNPIVAGAISYANIEQIGSSAIVNPWILSGSNTYNTTGNVGIGTTSPIFSSYSQLTVKSTTEGGIAIQAGATNYSRLFFAKDDVSNAEGLIRYYHSDNSMQFFTAAAERMRITSGGNVGIGTTSPAAPLHVASFATQSVGAYGYLAPSGAGTNSTNQSINYSIQADQRIRAPEFNAISDARIKKDIKKLNTEKQLANLNKLNVVNYSYIDQLVNGNKLKTGFIAQEVESVNSQFVNQSKDFIPSVFALAKSTTLIQDVARITTDKPHGFEKGDVVKFFAEGKKEIIKTIDEVRSPYEFSIKEWDAPTHHLFVYGKKVIDFRAIDFDQITALSVGAIQELSKQMESLKRDNATLNKILTDEIQKQQSEIEKRLLKLESKITKRKR